MSYGLYCGLNEYERREEMRKKQKNYRKFRYITQNPEESS